MIPQVKKPDVKVLGWSSYTWSAVVRPVVHTAKFTNNDVGGMIDKLTFNSLATAL